jgi:L-glyceraldehyde 3-phosphate reductase
MLGSSDLDVFPLCLGGNVFGWTADEEASFAVLDAYVAAGGNFVDTAASYSAWVPGNSGGESETIIGSWLASRSNRDAVVIGTKIGPSQQRPHLTRETVLAGARDSLARLQSDHIDLYYIHHDDPQTPLEETLGALDTAVRQGKALYVGISSYSDIRTHEAVAILRGLGTPLLIHQPSYSMFNRWIEDKLLDELERNGVGCIAFSPLAQGLLTDRYLDGIPADSRASRDGSLSHGMLSEENLSRVRALREIATRRGQRVSQMAIAWALRDPRVTSVLLGASSVAQLEQNLASLNNLEFSSDELAEIDLHAVDGNVNLWSGPATS